MANYPTIVTVPCFSGSPWQLEQLTPLANWRMRTMRLPETLDDIEDYADFLAKEVTDLDHYVLVGDSFGANIALAFATRQPIGLKALVLSGGFAANPVTDPITKLKLSAAALLPGKLYQEITLRFHAQALASPFDKDGQVPLSTEDFRELFINNTPRHSYLSRMKAAFSADYSDQLSLIRVPTLIVTPSYDQLIGEDAARQLVKGIPEAVEVVIPNTGHMFRFTHPVTYANVIKEFLESRVVSDALGTQTIK
ncbi:alpha/beta hydrolase [Aetokthonos hydrillicola Thurmond2011]|jgi:pimeloyl-ACP methyl ester carboxylesterase|uniref:Alpha/beta hydrolase n=1 Tax=Aetokthonos hydrillicola Thurmond2011 TaxID=2712845 RepID=A0AAP5IEP6_9CYAN|nr:alpha/beta hydrolase [Aetokthonos hydrillicola]MBO3459174.1 alpha/beta hydrolase [Aetokthonos hydrillicola CCALA 1050]MBW4584133.1 alpha/beta hydrolase [Aetokthonos hydrillicola CCALA 1050]MDR9898333.1 alpha/beta hydrolase [Aetokthonos hydrillicola Thurmond2011]